MAEVQPIALQVQAPQLASPISTIGSLMQLRSGMADLALKQQQTQQSIANTRDIEQQTALRQRQVADSNTLQDAMKDPDAAGKLAAGDYSPVQGKVSPAFLQTIEKARLENVEKRATLSEAQLKLNDTMHTELGESLDGVLHTARGGDDSKPADPALLDQLWQGARQHLVSDAGYKPDTLPQHIQSEDEANQVASINNASQSLNSAALTRKGELQKIAASEAEQTKNEADAALAAAKTPGATAESQMAQRKADLQKQAVDQFQANPQAGGAVIDSVLPASLDKTSNAAYHAAYQAAMQNGGPDAAQKVIEAAATHAASIGTATNPLIRKAEVQKAVDTAQATSDIEIGKAIATAKALRQGDNPAVAGVAPAAVPQVQNSAIKADQDYIAAKTAGDSIQKVLELARGGNVAAGANVPLMGVGAVNAVAAIKRINSAEIAQYGTAGSLVQKIQGKLEGWTEGKPIPDSVLNDMADLHSMLTQDAYGKYQDTLSSLNTRTGSKFAPAFDAPAKLSSGMPSVSTQADFDKLPSGAIYLEDGKKFRKP